MDTSDSIPTNWERGIVESNGIDLAYVRSGGDGSPLLISHGVFSAGRCWLPVARELQGDYDVICYDARGHGRSEAPESGYNARTMATDLLGLIDTLGLDAPYLLGHSMGGDAVATVAAHEPRLPRGVVLVEPAGLLYRGPTDEAAGTSVTEARNLIEEWQAHTKTDLLETNKELRSLYEDGRTERSSLLADARLRVDPAVSELFAAELAGPDELYPQFEVSTLILRADVAEDQRERDRDLIDPLPVVELSYIDGAGHTVFRDQPARALQHLRTFLDDT